MVISYYGLLDTYTLSHLSAVDMVWSHSGEWRWSVPEAVHSSCSLIGSSSSSTWHRRVWVRLWGDDRVKIPT